MFAWALLLQVGVGGPSLGDVAELQKAGENQVALEKVRELDVGAAGPASCLHANLAEAEGYKLETFHAVRRCVAHLRWELLPHAKYSDLETELRQQVTKLVPDGDVAAEYGGSAVEWPLWVERYERVSLEIALPDGSTTTRTFRADGKTVRVSPPDGEQRATTSITFNGDVDASTTTTTTNNYVAERPPGAFPLRKSAQVAGVVAGLAGLGLAGYGAARYVSTESAANRSADYTNANGGCPAAGSRCAEYDEHVERRDDSRRFIVTGGAVAGFGIAAVVVGAFMPRWIGGEVDSRGARFSLRGTF